MSLELAVRHTGDVAIITCTGRIVLGTEADSLKACLDETLPMHRHVLLHLGGVDFIDSGGLGVLARYLTRAQNANGTLMLCTLSPKVNDVLRVTRLKSAFQIYDTEADSLGDLTRRAPPLDTTGHPDILCVDSSPDVLAYLRELLKEAGYSVITASNFPDALILLKATRPRLVVIGAELRATVGSWAAQEFNRIANQGPVVELPEAFSARDAGDAAHLLLDAVSGSISARADSTGG